MKITRVHLRLPDKLNSYSRSQKFVIVALVLLLLLNAIIFFLSIGIISLLLKKIH